MNDLARRKERARWFMIGSLVAFSMSVVVLVHVVTATIDAVAKCLTVVMH